MNRFVKSLTRKHRAIERKIQEELRRIFPDTLRLQQLKKSRLALKDQLFQLSRAQMA